MSERGPNESGSGDKLPLNVVVKRVTLPSGRIINIFEYKEVRPEPEIHICPQCEYDNVQPKAWKQIPDYKWWIFLECPNCEWNTEGEYTTAQVEKLEDNMDEHLTGVIASLQQIAGARMSSDVEAFVTALEADFILPEDF